MIHSTTLRGLGSLGSVDADFNFGQLRWRTVSKITSDNLRQGARCNALGGLCKLVERPPMKAIKYEGLSRVRHMRLEAIDENEVKLLTLAESAPEPVEGVLTTAEDGPNVQGAKAELFVEFTAESVFNGFVGQDSAARRNPEILFAGGLVKAHQQNIMLRREQDGANGLTVNH